MCTECSCCSTTDTTTAVDAPGSVRVTVTGMTCGGCAGSVTRAIQAIDGVRDVAVDLATGAVTVTSDGQVSDDAVAAAVRDAGYQVA